MRFPLYRSLKMPESPVAGAPDFWDQCDRYWRESETWWNNWQHNLIVSVILWPGLTVVAMVIIAVVVS